MATVDLKAQLDLTRINSRTRNSEYNPGRFSGLIMRIREPRTTALIFKSGKIVCTGARNESDALLASKKFARIVEKVGFQVVLSSAERSVFLKLICFCFAHFRYSFLILRCRILLQLAICGFLLN